MELNKLLSIIVKVNRDKETVFVVSVYKNSVKTIFVTVMTLSVKRIPNIIETTIKDQLKNLLDERQYAFLKSIGTEDIFMIKKTKNKKVN